MFPEDIKKALELLENHPTVDVNDLFHDSIIVVNFTNGSLRLEVEDETLGFHVTDRRYTIIESDITSEMLGDDNE